jgi:hypothetical protein
MRSQQRAPQKPAGTAAAAARQQQAHAAPQSGPPLNKKSLGWPHLHLLCSAVSSAASGRSSQGSPGPPRAPPLQLQAGAAAQLRTPAHVGGNTCVGAPRCGWGLRAAARSGSSTLATAVHGCQHDHNDDDTHTQTCGQQRAAKSAVINRGACAARGSAGLAESLTPKPHPCRSRVSVASPPCTTPSEHACASHADAARCTRQSSLRTAQAASEGRARQQARALRQQATNQQARARPPTHSRPHVPATSPSLPSHHGHVQHQWCCIRRLPAAAGALAC